SVECSELPGGRGDGQPLTSFIELAPGARFAHAVDAQPGKKYLVANSGGYGFIVAAEDLLTRVKAGKGFMTLEEGDEVIRPAAAPGTRELGVCVPGGGRMLVSPAEELKEMARGRGVTLMGLDDGEKLVAVGFASGGTVTVTGSSRSGKERTVEIGGKDLGHYV